MFRHGHRCAATLLACFILSTNGAFAQALPDNPSLSGQVSTLEITVYGTPNPDMSLLQRIDNIEKILFGAPQPGGINTRVQKLQQTVFNQQPSAPSAPALVAANFPANAAEAAPSTADAKETRSLLQAGVNYIQQNNQAQAQQMFQQALVIDPNNADALFNLGALMEKDGYLSQALSYYQQAAASRPNDPEIMQAVNTIEARVAANQAVPAPLQQAQPFSAHPFTQSTQTAIGLPLHPNTASANVTIPRPTSQKAKGLLHKIGQIAKVGAVVAATVLENSSVSYGGAAPVDSCVCQ